MELKKEDDKYEERIGSVESIFRPEVTFIWTISAIFRLFV